MIERIIILEDIDPVVFFGTNNSHIHLLKTLYPKIRISARGNVIKVVGDAKELISFEEKIRELEKFSVDTNELKEEDILDIVKGAVPESVQQQNLIIYGLNGKPILARTENQRKLVEEFDKNDMVFAIGPAGSGKTYTAIALAVRALKNREVKKIILSRPAVEAGEKLGFLPGDMKDKIAQNTSKAQIKMFLTRMGMNAKMIVTGDVTQIDLPSYQQSGLVHSLIVLNHVKGVGKVEFNKKDIVRHKLVQRIVDEEIKNPLMQLSKYRYKYNSSDQHNL